MNFFTVKIALLTLASFTVDAQKTTCTFDVCIKDCVTEALTNVKPDIKEACEEVCAKKGETSKKCKKCYKKEAQRTCENQDSCKRPFCDNVLICDCDCKDATDADTCKAECRQCKADNQSAMGVCFSSCAQNDCKCDCDESCAGTECAGGCSEECGGDGSSDGKCKSCMKKCEVPCKECVKGCDDQKCVGLCACQYPFCKGKKGKKDKKDKKGNKSKKDKKDKKGKPKPE